MRRLSPAETLLQRYGVAEPRDIDLEALAYAVGARVKYRRMETCEARITGIGEKAVITIDDRYGAKRARFSLSHEMGHWHHHRNQRLYCAKQDIGAVNGRAKAKERDADRYAADLMMPQYLFEPMLRAFSCPSFSSIDELAAEFDASRKAAALRFVTLHNSPSMLICYGPERRKWYRPSPSWPEKWIPKIDHDPDTDVMDLLFGKQEESKHRSLYPASAFFGRYDAEQHGVYAHSVLSRSSDPQSKEVLTFLVPQKASMFDEEDW